MRKSKIYIKILLPFMNYTTYILKANYCKKIESG